MDTKSKSSPENDNTLEISNSDHDSTSLTNQATKTFENNNIVINNCKSDKSEEKISNLDFINFPSNNDEVNFKNNQISFSPDDNISSNNSRSGNEEDNNVEYKLIEKNLNKSLLNDDKFNLFFKKSLIDENFSLNQNDSLEADWNKHDKNQNKNSKLVLLNEETLNTKEDNLIICDEFDKKLYNIPSNCPFNNHYDDFIEEDIVPSNIKPLLTKKCINDKQKDKNFTGVDSNIKKTNDKCTIFEENSTQSMCSNLCMFDKNQEENTIYHDKTNTKSNDFEDTQSELKFESLSFIEGNDLKNKTLLFNNSKETNHAVEKDLINEQTNKAAFIWSETEAIIQQHEQTSSSACGATAILNILKALNFNYDESIICSNIKVNQRIPESLASETDLAKYLYSRSIAGMNSLELIENIENATQNKISGRFFSFYPERDVDLTKWLIYWIQKGAVPSALLNLQKIPIWGFIPDAWHHQMIYACELDCIYLTNPLEVKTVDTIMKELTSESVLLVRTLDVIKRFNANNLNLVDLLKMEKCSMKEKKIWFDMNVIGQCVNVLREVNSSKLNEDLQSDIIEKINEEINYPNDLDQTQQDLSTLILSLKNSSNQPQNSNSMSGLNQPNFTHIVQPASYVPGITLFAYKDSLLFNEIMFACELPLLKQNNQRIK